MTTTESKKKNKIFRLIKKTKILIESKPILMFSISALIACVLLNLGIFKDYAFRDAHEYIWTANNNPNFQNEFIQGGRFLLGIICEFVYGDFSQTISDLKWVRLFSLLTCVVFSVQIFSFLLKLKFKIYESALFSFLILTLPTFTVYIGWTATHEIPLLLSLCFAAGVLLQKNFNSKPHGYLNYFVALFLVVFSMCIYQPAATAFLIPFIFPVVLFKKFNAKKTFSILVFLGISFITYFFVFKLSLYWYNLEPTNRSSINLIKLPLKVAFFYLREMRMLLAGSGIMIWHLVFLCIGGFGFLGFFYSLYQKRTQIPQFVLFILLLVLILPISYLPNLLSSGDFVCSRTIAPAAIIVLFYQFTFFRELCFKYRILKKYFLVLSLLLIIISSINLNFYIAKIQNKEYKALKMAFSKVPLNNTKKIIIIKPDDKFLQGFKYYKRRYADEFGQVSSSRIWVPTPMFNQILKERIVSLGIENNAIKEINIEVYDFGDKYDDTNSIVINLIDILKKEFIEKGVIIND